MTRVFIVAASPLSHAGLENMLAVRDVQVVGTAGNLASVTGQLADAEADVMLIDSSGDSLEALLESLAESELASEVAIVVLADHAQPTWLANALRAGVRAVLPSDTSPDQIVASIQAVDSGLVVMHPDDVTAALPAVTTTSSPPAAELTEPLTRREREVLQMLAAGLGNKEIAARLSISDHTAKFHVASILGKLGAASRTEAVSLGIRHGLILL